MMNYRRATFNDWDAMMQVRLAVQENVLQNKALVTARHYQHILAAGGCGWVCEEADALLGFAIADLARKNIWALFILPGNEKQGIGQTLHRLMLDWSFGQGVDALWLTTGPGTRAEKFYEAAGWRKTGIEANGEIRFELTKEQWLTASKGMA